jgi:hypothetical protein
MNKTNAVVYLLLVTLLATTSFGVFQYAQNFNLTEQNNNANLKLEMSAKLTQLQFQINSELQKLDLGVQAACKQLSNAGLDGEQARVVLSKLVTNNSLIVNAATCNVNDTIIAVEPSTYGSIEGINIGDQEQNVQLHASLKPAMSNTIHLVEGFDGVVMVAPIFESANVFMGSLSIVIEPSALLNATIAPAAQGMPYTLWAMQIDGRIIYDADPSQEGLMLFSDPVYVDYPELLTLGHQIANEASGFGTYQYHRTLASESVVKKEGFWTTMGIYGSEWRLVIVHVVNQ